MTYFYKSQKYTDISTQLDKICSWLDSLGIKYSQTRIGKYKSIFSSLAKHQLADTLDTFNKEYSYENWVNAVYEVEELARIYEGLSGQNSQKMVLRLQKALKGHELYVLDSKGSSGRDFSLELAMAAKFVRSGYLPDFGNDADIKVKIGNIPFFVECKRLKSSQQIPKRIDEGFTQLQKRYNNSSSSCNAQGMLVLSIGRIIYPDLGFLEVDDEKSISEKAYSINEEFIIRYSSHLNKKVDPRTLGVAVVLDCPGRIKATKKIFTCHEVTIINIIPKNTKGYSLLQYIVDDVFNKSID